MSASHYYKAARHLSRRFGINAHDGPFDSTPRGWVESVTHELAHGMVLKLPLLVVSEVYVAGTNEGRYSQMIGDAIRKKSSVGADMNECQTVAIELLALKRLKVRFNQEVLRDYAMGSMKKSGWNHTRLKRVVSWFARQERTKVLAQRIVEIFESYRLRNE